MNDLIREIDDDQYMQNRYERAQLLMSGVWNQKLVKNDSVSAHWIENFECFWYERSNKAGKEYRLVDAEAGSNRAAFDHVALAEALTKVSGQEADANDLPIKDVSIYLSSKTVEFTAFEKVWTFDCPSQSCTEKPVVVNTMGCVVSPDGRLATFRRGNNLWIREISNGDERPLTRDGEEYYVYGASNTAWGFCLDDDLQVLWSPDSQKLFTVQRDTRQVKATPVVRHVQDSGDLRPTVEFVKSAHPNDEQVETLRLLIIDVETGDVCNADYRNIPSWSRGSGFFTSRLGWWKADSRFAYFIDLERYCHRLKLIEIDAKDGSCRIIFQENSNTAINLNLHQEDYPFHVFIPESNELIWYSERSGWAHLYLYNLTTGDLKKTITEGQWLVRDVLHYDSGTRDLFIQTAGRVDGRDPYYLDICRVNIDTGTLYTLCSSDDEYTVHSKNNSYGVYIKWLGAGVGNHTAGVSPSGKFLVATRSRADIAPVSFLASRDGDVVLELEVADTSNLPDNWHWPEPFQFTSADCNTKLYGLMFRPSGFCSSKTYPVINWMTSSPLIPAVLKGSFFNGKPYAGWFYLQMAALAELGFVVIVIDSRGTPLRSKQFLDYSYGNIPSSCDIDDHIAGLTQLAQRYSFIDINKVGIYGPGGYQGAIDNLFKRSDFYSVGVINMLQDARLQPSVPVGDRCEGRKDAKSTYLYPEQLVGDFSGKLMLTHPLLDVDHLPANTLRLVDALQNANKDFDLILFPTLGHDLSGYQIRRGWDFFVKNLLKKDPPLEFNLTLGY